MENIIPLQVYDQKRSFAYFLAFLQNKIDQEGYKQVDIARAISIRPEYINRVYKGRQSCSVDVQEKIAQHFGITYQEAISIGRQLKEPEKAQENHSENLHSIPPGSTENNRRKTDMISASDIVSVVSQWAIKEKETQEELTRLQNIIENLSEGVVILDTDLKIEYQNRSHRNMFGASLEGQQCSLAHGCEQHIGECPSIIAKRTGMPANAIFPYPNGSVSALTTPIRNFSGEITGYVTVVRDITERQKLKVMTELSLELIGNAVIIYDENHNIKFHNSKVREITGADDVHLVNFESFFSYLEQNNIFTNVETISQIISASKNREEVSTSVEFNDGKVYLYTAKPIFDNAHYIGRIGIFTPLKD